MWKFTYPIAFDFPLSLESLTCFYRFLHLSKMPLGLLGIMPAT